MVLVCLWCYCLVGCFVLVVLVVVVCSLFVVVYYCSCCSLFVVRCCSLLLVVGECGSWCVVSPVGFCFSFRG